MSTTKRASPFAGVWARIAAEACVEDAPRAGDARSLMAPPVPSGASTSGAIVGAPRCSGVPHHPATTKLDTTPLAKAAERLRSETPSTPYTLRAADLDEVRRLATHGSVCLRGLPRSGNSRLLGQLVDEARARGEIAVKVDGSFLHDVDDLAGCLDHEVRRQGAKDGVAALLARGDKLTVHIDEAVAMEERPGHDRDRVVERLRELAATPGVVLLCQVHAGGGGDTLSRDLGFAEHRLGPLTTGDMRTLLDAYTTAEGVRFSDSVVATIRRLAPFPVMARFLACDSLNNAAADGRDTVTDDDVEAASRGGELENQLHMTGIMEASWRLSERGDLMRAIRCGAPLDLEQRRKAADLASYGLLDEHGSSYVLADNLTTRWYLENRF